MKAQAAGSFIPGTTLLHRLDVRVKVILLLVWSVALFAIQSLPVLVGVLVMAVFVAMRAGISPSAFERNLAPMWIVFGMLVVMQSLRFDGTAAIALTRWVGISPEGLLGSACSVLRIVTMVAFSLILTATTSVNALTDALARIMGPMRGLGVPVDDVATMLGIALRFIPITSEQIQVVIMAQRARGARIGQGNLRQRIMSWVPVLIPVFVGLFRRAEALADAMVVRGYGLGVRTSLGKGGMASSHVVVLIVGIASAVALALVC